MVREAMMAFNVGDVVRLKSGGPLMTIVEIDDEEVTCVWFPTTDYTQVRRTEFIDAALEKVRE